jgi:hypothetical protein
VIALQSLQPQFQEQSTGQSVLLHVESVSIVLFAVVQIAPPLLTSLVTLYVLVLVPLLEAFIPSQVATESQAVHSPQLPTQLTEQSVF